MSTRSAICVTVCKTVLACLVFAPLCAASDHWDYRDSRADFHFDPCTYGNAYSGANFDDDVRAHCYTYPGIHTHRDSGTDAHSRPFADTDSNCDADTGAYSNVDPERRADSQPNAYARSQGARFRTQSDYLS